MTVGSGAFTYRGVPDWPEIPEAAEVRDAVGVGVDSQGRVVIFVRGSVPVLIFEADGSFVDGWGTGRFERPHGIFVASDLTCYLADDLGHHVAHYALSGELLRQIGPTGVKADTGMVGFDYRMIRPGVGPYNQPTNVALDSEGRIFVSDGYGNARVHRFSADGELELSWGEPGSGPGQFNVPHGIATGPDDRIYVSDRENSRVQVFSPDGELLSMLTDIIRPCQAHVDEAGNVYVAELGERAGVYPFNAGDPAGQGGRVSIFDAGGTLRARWGSGDEPMSVEDFHAPHGIAVDAEESIYTTEVVTSASSELGDATRVFPAIRKFERVAG